MEHYDNWHDLEKLGINMLTGEACGLSMRLLCDVNQIGRETVDAFFRCCLGDDSNWNSMVNGQPAVASVMLTRSIFTDLAAFAHIFQTGRGVRICDNGEVLGLTGEEDADYLARVERCYPGRWVGKTSHPGTGIDNSHAMSGRTA